MSMQISGGSGRHCRFHQLKRSASLLIAALFVWAGALHADSSVGARTISLGFVYVMTNQPAGNTIIQYGRANDGALTKLQEVSTGGLGGTGNGVGALDPLGSQDSLVLTDAASLLVAVNAGSDSVSTLAAGTDGLALISTVASEGSFPNSVAVRGTLVYVLNAHTPNIAGFRLDSAGTLAPIPGALFPIPGGAAAKPHDIRFSPDGTRVTVTVEGTNEIDVFALDNTGVVTGVTRQPAAGTVRSASGSAVATCSSMRKPYQHPCPATRLPTTILSM